MLMITFFSYSQLRRCIWCHIEIKPIISVDASAKCVVLTVITGAKEPALLAVATLLDLSKTDKGKI